MPNEMNHAEVAEKLEHILKYPVAYGKDAIEQAAADERRIANGELVEVVHGHWIETTTFVHDGYDYSHVPTFTCSHCRDELEYQHPKYCSECGALMDGKGDGEK